MSTRGGLAVLIFAYDHLPSNLTNVIPRDTIDVFRLEGNKTLTTQHDEPTKKQIHNYTPHPITVRRQEPNRGYVDRTFESKGSARVLMDPERELTPILGIPVRETYSTGTVIGLPEPQENVYIVVSLQTYIAAHARWDLLVTHNAERDLMTGRILRCTGFCRPALEMITTSRPT
jgi:hypothetical protein